MLLRAAYSTTRAPITASRVFAPPYRLTLLSVGFAAILALPAPAFAARYETDQVSGVSLSASEVTRSATPDIEAISGILVTPDGRALWSRRADDTRAMASTTKMMTALVALERYGLEDEVTVSLAAGRIESALGLHAGEKVSVRKLCELALVASSNDAAIALAEHYPGGSPAFVRAMNERAKRLGLTRTRFVNPHGLDASGHHSSAADLASLSQVAMGVPEFRRIVSMKSVTLPAHAKRPAVNYESTDELLGRYRGLLGVKTGFTDDAKYSFVASAERDGVTLTAVVLGAVSDSARFAQSARLLDWGFRHVSMRPVATATQTVDSVPISQNPAVAVPVRCAETTTAVVFDLDGPITQECSLTASVRLPVFEGQHLGEIAVMQGDRVLTRVRAVAATSAASAEETAGAVPVSNYLDRTVVARAARVTATVPEYDASEPMERRVQLDPQARAPIAEGDVLGEIVYSQGDRVVIKVPVVAAHAVDAPPVADAVRIWFARGWRTLTGAPTMASLEVIES